MAQQILEKFTFQQYSTAGHYILSHFVSMSLLSVFASDLCKWHFSYVYFLIILYSLDM